MDSQLMSYSSYLYAEIGGSWDWCACWSLCCRRGIYMAMNHYARTYETWDLRAWGMTWSISCIYAVFPAITKGFIVTRSVQKFTRSYIHNIWKRRSHIITHSWNAPRVWEPSKCYLLYDYHKHYHYHYHRYNLRKNSHNVIRVCICQQILHMLLLYMFVLLVLFFLKPKRKEI